jgi:hypothetical protein
VFRNVLDEILMPDIKGLDGESKGGSTVKSFKHFDINS